MIYIATQPLGRPILSRKAANISALAKIMQSLCKGNLLLSYRGRTGGFCLRGDAGKATLMQVVHLIEGVLYRLLRAGLEGLQRRDGLPDACDVDADQGKNYEQTLDHLAAAVQSGKCRICDLLTAVLGAKTAVYGL